jgi:COP9 signalosome complex subunit 7a helix I domain
VQVNLAISAHILPEINPMFAFQSEIGEISRTLQNWFEGCDEMLACLQDQAMRANSIKATNFEHKINIEKKVKLCKTVSFAIRNMSLQPAIRLKHQIYMEYKGFHPTSVTVWLELT